ncbi:MAG TPA: RsmG family class I SAM-dependent methyltransferase, partial [Candidatus Saccharimonadales bacterium]|nr:RsmG family class I SAM-dependent methyltransferase [Candidatus Saccharimonadales bacterium]
MTTSQSTGLSEDTIRRALSGFGVSADDGHVALIQRYMRILVQWNEKLNLTAIRDPLEILHRHFCESMFAATAVPIEVGRLADIGSGAGFPGIPLKIARPEL